MTRDEFEKLILKFKMSAIHYKDSVNVISVSNFEKISSVLFDSIESRTCKNCASNDEEWGGCDILQGTPPEGFGCNQFISKDD